MSSSDYTSVRKMKQMYSHQNDHCRNNDYGKRFDEFLRRIDDFAHGPNHHHHNHFAPLGYNRHNGIGYYVPHQHQHQIENNHDHDHDGHPHIRSKIGKLTVTSRYHTKTIRKYLVTPIKGGAITFTVDLHLHNFAPEQSVSVYSDTNANNFFEGNINSYDPSTGEITLDLIDSINGDYSTSSVYNVCLLTLNPDLIQLKNRMNDLYQYLFQVNLEEYPNYNPVIEQKMLFSRQICNLYIYFFNLDLTGDPNYQINDYEYLDSKINFIYQYFFNLDITQNLDFNQNGNQIKLFSIKSRINQLYLYLFNIDLLENEYFDPNLI
jgi:hypothetical protein